MNKVTPEDIKSIIDLFNDSDWGELHIHSDEFEIHLAKDPAARSRLRTGANIASEPDHTQHRATVAVAKPLGGPAAPAAAAVPEGMLIVRAPNLGTFYKAPKPGAPPYVEIGDRVEPDTEVCVIEVMKLFTPVRAGVTGIVRQALVNDTELVEFDQPLFMIEPSD
jgi:acetyl-CoA carboxylase biotin carboxyl carrier protein